MKRQTSNLRQPGDEETAERLNGAEGRPSRRDFKEKTYARLDVPGPLSSALDRLKDGLIIVDGSGLIIYANDAGKKILGRDAAVGMGFSDAYPKLAGSKLVTRFKEAVLDKKEARSLEYVPHAFRWYNVTIYPSAGYIALFFRESTSDFRLGERYKLTHFSMENFQDYAFWVRLDGQVYYANKSARENLGYFGGELACNIREIIEELAAADWGEFTEKVKEKVHVAFESSIKTRRGGKIIGDVWVDYLVYAKQEYLVIFIKDITGRKRAEEEREEARAQAELYLDLMGHDINNLNQVAMGYLELISGMVDDEELKELISRPLDAITSSSRLIDNVRKLKNSKGLKTEAIDLNDVIAGLQAQYSNASDKEVTINFIPGPGAIVMANSLIRDVFSNLIWNAIKHSNEKVIQIDISIVRSIKEGRENYEVMIEDHGPGIPDELKAGLFSRFQKGNLQAHGKGLGLYLVRTLMEDYHGKAWVEDRVPGDYTKGSRFVVMLPVSQGAP